MRTCRAAKILRPRHAVVEYVGREQLLAALADWCEQEPQDGESAGLWFVTGGGGFGKTRLAVEACREAEARGWTAGLLTPGASEAKLQELAEWPGRLLIAVDYAENTPALIGQLAEELAARAPRPPVRIMLLVRRRSSRADLLGLFNEQREEQLDALLRQASDIPPGGRGKRGRPAGIVPASACGFRRLPRHADRHPRCGHRGCGPHISPGRCTSWPPPTLHEHLRTTDVDALSEADLLRTLLAEHEAESLEPVGPAAPPRPGPADQRTAVAVATLLTAEGEDEALTMARLIPHFGEEPESRLIAIARWLAQLYPPPGGSRAARHRPART